ncbi:hypothetical protein RHMOL_Rhmol01G0262700 [Rhododendron molle]|uniref:Uncharacterized protein n=1 Tax=Rhododendron molle TaxID=49168 RepID=A0ACC0Q915_RHOML|nr:hypothetical protein RHMOL_Rhmol01G0262700 [Rhododendron molle]
MTCQQSWNETSTFATSSLRSSISSRSPHLTPLEVGVEEEAIKALLAAARGAVWSNTSLDSLSKTVSSLLVRRVVELTQALGIGNAPVLLTPKTYVESDPPSRGSAPAATLTPPRIQLGLGRDLVSPILASPKLPTTKTASWSSRRKGTQSASRALEPKAHSSRIQGRRVAEAMSPSASSPTLKIATRRTDMSALIRDCPDRSIRPHRDTRLKRLTTSPFTREIDSVTPSKGFTQPKFAKYDGKTKAYTHLVQYKLVMSLFLRNEPSDDAFLCKYADRYWELFNEIEGYDGVILARGFKLGLTSQDEQVYDDLARNKPDSMKDLMTRIEGWCQLIESKAERGIEKSTGSKITSVSANGSVPTPVSTPKKQINNIKQSPKKGQKPSDFNAEKIVFTIPIYRIINQVKDQPFFSFPNQKLSTENGKIKNPIVRCSYHNEQGHFTTACKPFKAYLE